MPMLFEAVVEPSARCSLSRGAICEMKFESWSHLRNEVFRQSWSHLRDAIIRVGEPAHALCTRVDRWGNLLIYLCCERWGNLPMYFSCDVLLL